MYDAGTAALAVVPQFKGVESAIRKQASQWGVSAGQAFGSAFNSKVKDDTGGSGAPPVGPDRKRSQRQGQEAGGSFADGFQRRVKAALKNLPPVNISVARNEAEQEIKDLSAQLRTLSDQRIGIDVDATAALAEVQRIQARLDEVSRSSPDVQVRADTLAAAAQLAAITAQVERLTGRDVTVNVDADTAGATAQIAAVGDASNLSTGRMQSLIGVGIGLGPLIAPAAATAAAAVAAIGPAALSGAAGLGVVALGVSGVVGAVKQMSAVDEQAAQSAVTLAGQQSAVAAAVDGVRSAERALANTRTQVADGARRAAQQVADAQRALTAAERDALRVRQDLSQAQREARQALEDLASQVSNNALDQRQANFDVAEARRELDRVLADPKATQEQRTQAQITYDRQVLQQEDLRRRGKRLQTEQTAAVKAGVEGSDQVRAARQRIADADEQVAAAQRSLSQARIAAQQQERQGAYQIAQGLQAVASAQRSVGTASAAAAVGGTSAMLKLQQAMDDLSPAGRTFAKFIFGLRGEFLSLRQAAERGLLPGVQAGIEALLPYLPQMRVFVERIGAAIGGLAQRAGEALASPFWEDFFDWLGASAGPMLADFGTVVGGLAKGFAALMMAFAPMSEDLVAGLAKMSTGFADWATSLSGSAGFEQFLDYVKANGPVLGKLLLDLVVVTFKLLVAFAPLGTVMLKALGGLADWLAELDPGVLLGLAGAVAVVVAAIFGPISAVIAVVVAFVGVWVYAYNRIDWFRAAVQVWFAAIGTAAMWLWSNAIQPAFAGIAAAVSVAWTTVIQPAFAGIRSFVVDTLAPAFVWLWNGIIEPAFAGIAAVISWAWTNVISPVLKVFVYWLKNILGPVVTVLWKNVIIPAWQGIKFAISLAWTSIKVVFGLIQIGVKALAMIFTWWLNAIAKPIWNALYSGVIRPAWEKIKPVFQALGGFIKSTVVPAFQSGVAAIGKAWEKIRDIAKIPVRFVVNTVLNNGILAAYNKLAKAFGVSTVSPIKLPSGFATGGYIAGPGTGTSDSVLARLSNGEYVIPARIVRRLGVDFFDQLIGRTGVSRPGDGSEGLAFALGGLVNFGKNIWDAVTNPIKLIKAPINAAIGRIPGAGIFRAVIAGMGHKLVDGLLGWIKGGTGTGGAVGDIGKAQAFARAQAGKPYVWAGVGPNGYDCSGLVGAAYRVAHGKSPHQRIFSTSNMARFFPRVGQRGAFTAGWAHAGERGGGSVGHTAANIAGLGVESRGGDGVVIGNRATPYTAFARWGTYDSGGYLPPGASLVINSTGRPEPVLTGNQYQTLAAAAARSGGTFNGVLVMQDGTFMGRIRGQMEQVIDGALGALADGRVYNTA
jgi:hypothetical protein